MIRRYISSPGFDPASHQTLGVFRLCNHGLIISLSKLNEIYKNYGIVIKTLPEQIRNEIKEIHKKIENKGIVEFRNTYAAHIFVKEKGKKSKPLSEEKGMEMLAKILGKNIEQMLEFYEWIYPESYNEKGSSVVSVVQKIRDHCISIGAVQKSS
jgi:hypothetical protein